jgi:hypothetical protein
MHIKKTAHELMLPQQRLTAILTRGTTKDGGKTDPLQTAIAKATLKPPANATEVRLGQQTIKIDMPLYAPRGEAKIKPAAPENTGPLPPDFQPPSLDRATSKSSLASVLTTGETRPVPMPDKQILLEAPAPIPHIGLAPTPLIDLL